MKKKNEPDGDIKDNEPAGRGHKPKVAGNTNSGGEVACALDGNGDLRYDYYEEAGGVHSLNELIQWIDDQKARNHIFQKREGLNTLRDWHMDAKGNFSHREGKYFTVVGFVLPRRTARSPRGTSLSSTMWKPASSDSLPPNSTGRRTR